MEILWRCFCGGGGGNVYWVIFKVIILVRVSYKCGLSIGKGKIYSSFVENTLRERTKFDER